MNPYPSDNDRTLGPDFDSLNIQRQTIDYGIDLGTTNSEIARLNGPQIEVFRNSEGFEYTPSAVWMNKQGELVVGRVAKESYERDPANAFTEFKRDMGTEAQYTFARTGMKARPEDLSAEVLKALRADVQRRTGEVIQAAVVTVPADFDLTQCEATKRAAISAGFQHSVLLTEPVAAAQAYGFERDDDRTLWLVYDFGGGTFDAAVIQVRDGLIQVLGSKGNNRLGGKNIDWAIVEQLFIPAITREFSLTNFTRGNERWRGAMAKLKIKAEMAKLHLSSAASTEVAIDYLCPDDNGEPVEFYFDMKRADLERIARPFIRQTVNLSREALTERHLSTGNVAKLLLVGGPTMMPFVRDLLADPVEGLGIPLEFSVDPLTVVARGAAIFAAGQRLPTDGWRKKVRPGRFGVKLDYEPVGPDEERQVAGVIAASEGIDGSLAGYTIEFSNTDASPAWRSGKVPLGATGGFMTEVHAERGKANSIHMELRDSAGNLQELGPSSFQITVGGTGTVQITLPHAIGVALQNNQVITFIERDSPLPKRERKDLHTAVTIKRGQGGQLLRVPVVQGDKVRADRNILIGTLEISAENITRDVPAGSEIEVTIDIDQSRLVRTKAYIPFLDEEFESVLKLSGVTLSSKDLREGLKDAVERLGAVRSRATSVGDPGADRALQHIEDEALVEEIERLVPAADAESDTARECHGLLNRLQSTIDEAEEAIQWPHLLAEAEKALAEAHKAVESSAHATGDDRSDLMMLERETREAINHRAPEALRRHVEGLESLKIAMALRDPGPWVGMFYELRERRDKIRDGAQAAQIIADGERAISRNDLDGLKTAVRGLIRLMPDPERPKSMSDVIL